MSDMSDREIAVAVLDTVFGKIGAFVEKTTDRLIALEEKRVAQQGRYLAIAEEGAKQAMAIRAARNP